MEKKEFLFNSKIIPLMIILVSLFLFTKNSGITGEVTIDLGNEKVLNPIYLVAINIFILFIVVAFLIINNKFHHQKESRKIKRKKI